jgi:hypothetical protein
MTRHALRSAARRALGALFLLAAVARIGATPAQPASEYARGPAQVAAWHLEPPLPFVNAAASPVIAAVEAACGPFDGPSLRKPPSRRHGAADSATMARHVQRARSANRSFREHAALHAHAYAAHISTRCTPPPVPVS